MRGGVRSVPSALSVVISVDIMGYKKLDNNCSASLDFGRIINNYYLCRIFWNIFKNFRQSHLDKSNRSRSIPLYPKSTVCTWDEPLSWLVLFVVVEIVTLHVVILRFYFQSLQIICKANVAYRSLLQSMYIKYSYRRITLPTHKNFKPNIEYLSNFCVYIVWVRSYSSTFSLPIIFWINSDYANLSIIKNIQQNSICVYTVNCTSALIHWINPLLHESSS